MNFKQSWSIKHQVWLIEKINALINEIVYQRLGQRPDTDVPIPTQVSPSSPANLIEDNRPPIVPGKRGGINNLDKRLEMSKLGTTSEKVALLEEMESAIPSAKSELTEPAPQFVNQILIPVLRCIGITSGLMLQHLLKNGDSASRIRISANAVIRNTLVISANKAKQSWVETNCVKKLRSILPCYHLCNDTLLLIK